MGITRQITADKIADYLHGKVSQAELVDWAERAMMEADFEEADREVLSDVIGRLGLAVVAAVTQPRAGRARPGLSIRFALAGLRRVSAAAWLPRQGHRLHRVTCAFLNKERITGGFRLQ